LKAAAEATTRGYQIHLHAIGDAAVRTALDVLETLSPEIQAVIAHAELISDVDLPRFAQLNVTANLQPLWAREDGQLMSCVPQVGRVRIDKLYRMRDLLNSAARLAFGSDWPVSSPNALTGVATAVNRSLPGGASWTIEQAVPVKEALNAYTNGVAAQLSNSARSGTLFPGDRAEFITLSQSPFEVPAARLFEIEVTQIYL
jgi:predicted amidohydrolase YtcJ